MQGHGPQAGAIPMRLLSGQRPLPDDAWPVLGLLVGHDEFPGYLEQLGQYDQAEKLLQEHLGNDSQKSMLFAGFLADGVKSIRPWI